MHVDADAGNTSVTRDNRMGLADSQVTHKGKWCFDDAYVVDSSLRTQDPQNWAADLLPRLLSRRKSIRRALIGESW